jgi:hypothetical protein
MSYGVQFHITREQCIGASPPTSPENTTVILGTTLPQTRTCKEMICQLT